MLYATIMGFSNSYKLANSTDGFIITAKSVSNYEQKHKAQENWFAGRQDIEFYNQTQKHYLLNAEYNLIGRIYIFGYLIYS